MGRQWGGVGELGVVAVGGCEGGGGESNWAARTGCRGKNGCGKRFRYGKSYFISNILNRSTIYIFELKDLSRFCF